MLIDINDKLIDLFGATLNIRKVLRAPRIKLVNDLSALKLLIHEYLLLLIVILIFFRLTFRFNDLCRVAHLLIGKSLLSTLHVTYDRSPLNDLLGYLRNSAFELRLLILHNPARKYALELNGFLSKGLFGIALPTLSIRLFGGRIGVIKTFRYVVSCRLLLLNFFLLNTIKLFII